MSRRNKNKKPKKQKQQEQKPPEQPKELPKKKKNIRVIVFEKHYAFTHLNPINLEDLRQLTNAIVDPDLRLVRGLQPRYWKLVNNRVFPMTLEEKNTRDEDIKKSKAPPAKSSVMKSIVKKLQVF